MNSYTFDSADIAARIIVETETHNGGTFSVYNGDQCDHSGHAEAFAVARGRGTTIVWDPDHESRNELFAIIRDTVDLIRDSDDVQYIGTWIDGGSWYIDIVDIVTDPVLAIVEGRTRGELAVWDLKEGREYRCNSDAETLASIREWYGITDIPELPR